MFDYEQLRKTVQTLPHDIIGQSVLHRNLYSLSLGQGESRILIHAAHHGLEQITTEVLMRFYMELLEASPVLLSAVTVDFVPMVNPDGVELALRGLSGEHPYYYDLKDMLKGADPAAVWQANIRGVDLNHNYDAGFESSKVLLSPRPGPTRYPGLSPESEPESRALANWTRHRDYDLTISLHSQGEEVYYGYLNYAPPYAEEIGQELANAAGYTLKKAEGVASFGGYKDWYTKAFRRCGYTVEVGRGKNPLPPENLPEIYRRVRELLWTAVTLPPSRYRSKDRSHT